MKSFLKTPIPVTYIDYDYMRKPGFITGVASYGNFFNFMISDIDGLSCGESSIDKICPREVKTELDDYKSTHFGLSKLREIPIPLS